GINLGIDSTWERVQGIKQGGKLADSVSARTGQRGMTDTEASLNKVYQDMLPRRAEPAGLAAWEAHLNQGLSRAQVVEAIMATPEGLVNQVTDLYRNVLHRLPDPSGVQTYTTFLAQGGTLTHLQALLLGSQEYFLV